MRYIEKCSICGEWITDEEAAPPDPITVFMDKDGTYTHIACAEGITHRDEMPKS